MTGYLKEKFSEIWVSGALGCKTDMTSDEMGQFSFKNA